MPNQSDNDKIFRLIQAEIQRYVLVHLLPQCKSEPLRFKERELARTLKVNRLTVHRAAVDLQKNGYLIQIKGRRGFFLNPESHSYGTIEKYYGVITHNGEVPDLTMEKHQILNGFFASARHDHYPYCQFLTLTGQRPERMAMEIMSYPLHALIWFFPPPEMFPVIDLLMERSLPVAVVSPIKDSRIIPYHTNTITLDHIAMGRMFAEKVLEFGFRKILFAGLRSPVYESFRKILNDSAFPFSGANFTEYTPENHDPEKLAEIIRGKKIELVVSDGMIFHDLKKLAGLTDFSNLHFLLLPLRYVKKLAAVHPEYHLFFPDYLFDNMLYSIGKKMAARIAVDPPAFRFQNEIQPLIRRKSEHN